GAAQATPEISTRSPAGPFWLRRSTSSLARFEPRANVRNAVRALFLQGRGAPEDWPRRARPARRRAFLHGGRRAACRRAGAARRSVRMADRRSAREAHRARVRGEERPDPGDVQALALAFLEYVPRDDRGAARPQ